MDEQTQEKKQETSGEKQETPTVAEERGNVHKELNLIEQAKIENDRREELIKQDLALQERKERLHAEQLVGGKSIMSVEEEKKETAKEYADKVMSGKMTK